MTTSTEPSPNNATTPKVDIVIRTKDRPHFLRRALQSVLDQTFQDWRIQLVATGDLEPVNQLLQELGASLNNRFTLVPVPEQSIGRLGELINIGMRNSTARYLGMLDDDDTWEPEFLQACVDILDKPPHPSVQGVVARSNVIQEQVTDDQEIQILRSDPLNPELRNLTLLRMAGTNRFPPNSLLFTRKALDKAGEFDPHLPVLEDWDFNLRLLQHYDIYLLDQYLSNYHQRTQSSSADGQNSNTVTGGENLHRYFESHLMNKKLRTELENGTLGLGYLMSQSQATREADDEIRRLRKKLDAISDKIGKIDSRTKQLKDKLT